jgi:hypothetical protein
MRRLIVTLALAAGMVLGGASAALAHPNEPAADPSPFNLDNAVFKSGLDNAKGPQVDACYDTLGGFPDGCFAANKGIVQGYFVHSPTCGLHPELDH